MLSPDQVSSQIEKIGYCSMSGHKPLGLLHRLESPHPSLPDPSHLMRLLSPIILILLGTVNRFRHHYPMGYRIASQLIGDNLPRLATMRSKQSSEEKLRCGPVPLGLKIDIHHIAILIHSPP